MSRARDELLEIGYLAMVVLAAGLVCLAILLCGCCGSAGATIGTALEGAAVTLDQVELAEGNAAIDRAKTKEEALAELDAIRARYRPAWVALSAALEADLAYLQDCKALPALVTAYCSLGKTAPQLKLPTAGVCP